MLKSFWLANKTVVLIAIVTLAIIGGGIYLFSKTPSQDKPQKVDNKLLVESDSERIGSPDAQITLVEFGDYECPACGAYHPFIKQLLTDFAGRLNFVFRNFPLAQHANAKISSYAAEAAARQGKFEVMHNKLYESQGDWANSTDAKSVFIGYATDLGLDAAKFTADMDSTAVKQKIDRDIADGTTLKINATPTFYLNGVKIGLPGSYEELKKIVQAEIDKNPIPTASGAAYHIHFDLKVYENGTAVDFTQAKYQETKDNPLDENIHFHDGNGKVVHVHKSGIALAELFKSLKINLPDSESGYVNGQKVEKILSYVPQDLDRILIGGSDVAGVSNDSCIYSLKCPDRGTPPPEDCVGGIGTGCTK